MTSDRKTFFRFAALGFVVALAYVVIAINLPYLMPVRPGWYHGGIRLFRDEGEIQYYFSNRSLWVRDGVLPYSAAAPQEYPPLAVLYYSWPRFVTNDYATYRDIFALQSCIVYGVLVGLTALLLQDLGTSKKRLALLLLPMALYLGIWRFDTAAAAFVALGAYACTKRRYPVAIAAFVAGAFIKVFPVVYLIPLALWFWSRRTHDKNEKKVFVRSLVAAAAAVSAIVLLAWACGLLKGLFGSLAAQIVRPYDVGSVGRTLLFTGGSWMQQIQSSPTYVVAVMLGLALLQYGAVVAATYLLKPKDLRSFVRAAMFIILPLMAFNRFFTESFLFWVLPPMLLVAGRMEMILLAGLELVLYFELPVLYGIDPFSSAFTAVGLMRTAVLVALWALNLRAMLRDRTFSIRTIPLLG